MGTGSFFKPIKNKTFNYTPIYYNPEMEDLHERVKKAKREAGIIDEADSSGKKYIPNIKGKMRQNLITQHYSSGGYSKIRAGIVLISIFLLIALFYLVLKLSGLFFVNG